MPTRCDDEGRLGFLIRDSEKFVFVKRIIDLYSKSKRAHHNREIPMAPDIIDFYYFSGTGNTLLIVEAMRDIFCENNIDVNLYKIEYSNPANIVLEHTIGLAFPVAVQSTYPFIWDFMKLLPRTSGTKIFMVDTLAMFSGGVVGPTKRILASKGYVPIGAREIIMPNNLMRKKINERNKARGIENGIAKAQKYAMQIIRGKSKWRRMPILSDIIYWMSICDHSWRFMRGKIRLNAVESKCSNCGVCVELCPIGNIEMDKKIPSFGKSCQLCMRCFSFCPNDAIRINEKDYLAYRAVKVKAMLRTDGSK